MAGTDIDALVAAAQAGGNWAFGRLWQELAPVVHAYAQARGAREPDDTTSEVFLAAFSRIDRFRGDGRAFRAWLFTIAHHKTVDGRRRGPGAREAPADVVDDGRRAPSAEQEALARLGTAEVHRLLDGLTPDQRAVLLLRIVGELTLAETAAVLGRPVSVVKALQHRGLARLRRELSGRAVPRAAAAAIARAR